MPVARSFLSKLKAKRKQVSKGEKKKDNKIEKEIESERYKHAWGEIVIYLPKEWIASLTGSPLIRFSQ